MLPLIALAADYVPEIIGHLAGNRAEEIAEAIAGAVRDIAGEAEAPAAIRAIQADPAKAAALKRRLEEIHRVYTALRGQEPAAAATPARLPATLPARLPAAPVVASASQAAAAAALPARAEGIQAWAPAIISICLLVGFFVLPFWIAHNPVPPGNEVTTNLLHITVGSLVTGFAAVVNFWLGANQGSRDRDRNAAALHLSQAQTITNLMEHLRDTSAQHTALVRAFAPVQPPVPALSTSRPAPALAPAPAPAPAPVPQPVDTAAFATCIKVVLAEEGGFVDNPADPGGATNMGITLRTLSAWRHRPQTVEDVRTLSLTDAQQIYKAQYWNVMRCQDLPQGVDLMVFDFGVNAGPTTSVRLLQRCVSVTDDGDIGPITLRAVAAANPRTLIEDLATGRLEFYRRLETFPVFGAGWTRRVQTVRTRALDMLA